MTHGDPSTAQSALTPSITDRPLRFSTGFSFRSLVGVLTLRAPQDFTDTEIHQRFVRAVTDWVKEDPAGKAIWNTCNDDDAGALQVGDLALMRSFHEERLKVRLAAGDLAFVSFDLKRDLDDRQDHFDAVLIDTTPEEA